MSATQGLTLSHPDGVNLVGGVSIEGDYTTDDIEPTLTLNTQFLGNWAVAIYGPIQLTKRGDIRCLTIPGILGPGDGITSVTITTAVGAIPAEYLPTQQCVQHFYVVDNGVEAHGTITLMLNGQIVIALGPVALPFAATALAVGFPCQNISYM